MANFQHLLLSEEPSLVERHSWGSVVIEKEQWCTNKVWTCSKCGCIKTASFFKKGKLPLITFERSGLDFHENMPECINWEKENSKTID